LDLSAHSSTGSPRTELISASLLQSLSQGCRSINRVAFTFADSHDKHHELLVAYLVDQPKPGIAQLDFETVFLARKLRTRTRNPWVFQPLGQLFLELNSD
jgi:hypothetical protein